MAASPRYRAQQRGERLSNPHIDGEAERLTADRKNGSLCRLDIRPKRILRSMLSLHSFVVGDMAKPGIQGALPLPPLS